MISNRKKVLTSHISIAQNHFSLEKEGRRDDSSEGIRVAVQEILGNAVYSKAAAECSSGFRACPGAAGAAQFVENAPHTSNGIDIISELNKENAKFQLLYWLIVIAVISLIGLAVSWKFVWVTGIAAGVLSFPMGKAIQKRNYKRVIRKKA